MFNHHYGEIGVHRAPVWRIAGFALNNAATNLYLLLMSFVSYAYLGFLGFGVAAAISLTMIFRLWDGITDPFIGRIIDKTNGKFGKNRPFMVIGNVILFLTSCLLVHLTHRISGNIFVRGLFLLMFGALYYIGYSFQSVVTKSAQSCLTSDPGQRPLFAAFDSVFSILLLAGAAIYLPIMAQMNGGYQTASFFHNLWLLVALASAAFTAIAVISIAPKDNRMYFGTKKRVAISKQDFRATLKDNRAIGMLAIAASTDKLAMFTGISAMIALNAAAGFHLLQTSVILVTAGSAAVLAFLLTAFLAVRFGQKEALQLASWVGIALNAGLVCLWLFGDSASMAGETAVNWGFFTIIYVTGTSLLAAFRGITGNIVIPMAADCVDYETYRTGKYIPGMIGAMLSMVDKLISMLAPLIAGLVFAAVGYAEDSNGTTAVQIGAVCLAYGMGILGLICNLLAMKSYPLSKAKMAEIHSGIASSDTDE